VRMPEMTGHELARRLRLRQPDLKVLYFTGFSDDIFAVKGVLWEGEAFLDKPATVEGILQAVSLLLYGTLRTGLSDPVDTSLILSQTRSRKLGPREPAQGRQPVAHSGSPTSPATTPDGGVSQ
jgi:FixJ family two-component response regulator